jgi:antitoxin PrlF
MGIILTVTAKGQVTLRKEVLEHLGISPGDQLEIDLLPAGRVQASARARKPASALFGRLHRPGERALTIEELKEEAAAGWAGER